MGALKKNMQHFHLDTTTLVYNEKHIYIHVLKITDKNVLIWHKMNKKKKIKCTLQFKK